MLLSAAVNAISYYLYRYDVVGEVRDGTRVPGIVFYMDTINRYAGTCILTKRMSWSTGKLPSVPVCRMYMYKQ